MTLGLLPNLHGTELIILLVLGLLIFGRRLPEVGRSLGRGIVEFRKGVKGIEDEVHQAETSPSHKPSLAAPSPVRPPLSATGQDVRVSRADAVEPGPAAEAH